MDNSKPEIIIATIMRRRGSSGLQTYINTLSDYINGTGGRATVLTPFEFSIKPVTSAMFAVRRVVDLVSDEASTWWYEYWHYYFLKLALSKKLRDNYKKRIPTIVYAQCPLSAKACLETRRPGQKAFMVVHFNVSQADEWAEKGKIKREGRLFRSIRGREQKVLPQLDGVVFVSAFMKKQIMQFIPELSGQKTACIPCFTNRPVSNAEYIQSSRDLISIGTLEARKNQSYLLKVLGELKTRGRIVSLTLVGDGVDRSALKSLCQQLGIESQVDFMGYQPNASRFIPGHQMYVHSALIENLPISLLEAQACGLPIFAPAVGGIPEIITDGKEGYFWPLDNPATGAELVMKLIDNTEAYNSLSQAAAQKFQSTFETEVVVQQLMKFWGSH